jgi:hypothetical protein
MVPDRADDEGPPSVGSIGHPFSCNAPCKYASKRLGCKDGSSCTRCHLCWWTRGAERNATEGSQDPTDCSMEGKSVLGIEASLATTSRRRRKRIPEESLSIPRRVEIQQKIVDDMPMYIHLDGGASLCEAWV